MPLFKFRSAAPKKLIFFKKIHSLNLRKEENLSFDIILFVDDSSLINKISLFDLTVRSQSGRGQAGMLILSIRCMPSFGSFCLGDYDYFLKVIILLVSIFFLLFSAARSVTEAMKEVASGAQRDEGSKWFFELFDKGKISLL